MKDKLKNTLEHEVEILGRSISVLAIAAVLIVGGASAALLTTYGQVTGEAQVTDQAVTVDGPDSVSYEGDLDVGQTTVDSFTVNSQTSETAVDYELGLEREAINGDESGSMDGVESSIYDASSTYSADFGSSSVEKSYDAEDDEVVFEIDISEASTTSGQLHVDQDDDGLNEFHLGLYANDFDPSTEVLTENEYGAVTQWVLNEDQSAYEQGSVSGVSAEISDQNVITISIDAEKLGSEFRYGIGVNGETEDYAPGDSDATISAGTHQSTDWSTQNPGEEVVTGDSSTTETVAADQSNSYVMVNEWAINLDPSYDYNVTAVVDADFDQDNQIEPE